VSLILYSEDEMATRSLGSALARQLAPDGVLLLAGDLGSGKTVLTQGIAAGLGIDPLQVQSPTFTLIREHQGHLGRLLHVDLYRLESEEVEALGLWELLAEPGVKVVEWAERIPFEVSEAMRLEIEVLQPPNRRRFELWGVDALEIGAGLGIRGSTESE
jgi:tRNA threonylcarbamoyladenosine biosynthesis protein TsaE